MRFGGAARVWLLVAGITALLVVLYTGVVRPLTMDPYPIHLPWPVLVLFFYAAEIVVAHEDFRREAHTLLLSEIGLVFGLFLVSPTELLAAQLIGAAVALAVSRRQRPLKVAFSVAQFGLCTCLALIAFHGIARGETHGPRTWAAVLVAVSLSSAVGVVLVAVATWLSQRAPSRRPLQSVSLIALLSALASGGVALAAMELLRDNAWTLVLLLVPVAACGLAFLAYTTQRRQHEHLSFLYESMRRIQQAPDFNEAVGEFLQAVRQMFGAEHAELILCGEESRGVLHARVAGDGRTVVRSTALAPDETLLVSAVSKADSAIVLPRKRDSHELDGLLSARGVGDAMAAPLRGEQGVHGVVMVADSVSDVSSFTPHDGRLFSTIAGHASVLLENDRLAQSLARVTELKEQLRHQAFHDALTGLPNRTLFAEHVRAALLRASRGDAAIVLFLDLDDFKTINDSLGHAAGDDLIAAVASRLKELVRPQDIPARLGGDEFAVLLEDISMAEAECTAERVVEGLAMPFVLRGRQICVHASAGLATTTSDVCSADELLCNADVAMYSAKESGKRRHVIYEPQMHSRVHARLELGAALERAVRAGEFGAHYQPIVSLQSGRVVGFEALLRWNRPRHGIVLPLDFLSIAEETGLISTINRVVLRQACRQARAWHDEFPLEQLAVSVNVSPIDLQNPLLDFEIATVLRESGLPADRLIIEVTESGAMRDPEAAIETMQKLRELGVRLALDDFGTGHSSLSYLQELPIDLLKIAKPFIDHLGMDRSAVSFAETIVRLAESLGIEVVAEGIEHSRQEKELLALECSLGQGFHFSQPLDPRATQAYLRLLNVRTRTAA
jgi:diguanylate cyclase (GGDEF)-like protein